MERHGGHWRPRGRQGYGWGETSEGWKPKDGTGTKQGRTAEVEESVEGLRKPEDEAELGRYPQCCDERGASQVQARVAATALIRRRAQRLQEGAQRTGARRRRLRSTTTRRKPRGGDIAMERTASQACLEEAEAGLRDADKEDSEREGKDRRGECGVLPRCIAMTTRPRGPA